MKRSWTPISPSGFHPLTEAELAAYFVDDFEAQYQPGRRYLLGRLAAYLHDLAALGLTMEIWLDGSFTTRCPEPNDIDLVVLLSYREVARLAHAEQIRLSFLLNERLRIRYACDVYHADIGDAAERHRWTQQFATNHDNTPKGIFTLTL
ncbi:hypothetical protein Q5H92_23325 [Hymenobacter sp. M29]|uniref:Polymerase nucleotidyl transferase domain-containing protein n=1 Tax=Hymenobacter mellowenesis TaxID=3063995 RepID=A0ABT9AHG5_9BACT|nr:hypothetical protein [Hymenobacter sp. M29]MDO7849315.1 hypothetical protein [Hymenobacter sp. M29]